MRHAHAIIAAGAFVAFSACQVEDISEQDVLDDSPIEVIEASVESIEDAEFSETRTTFDYTDEVFAWEDDDVVSFWPSSSDLFRGNPTCIMFKVAEGGSSTATFVGNGWALMRNTTYYASVPYSSGDSYNKVILKYAGQSQAANDDDSHLGAYDYLHACFTTPATGNASISFDRIGTIAKFALTIPEGLASRNFTSLALTCDDAVFPTEVYYDPSKSAVTLSKASMSKRFEIFLNGSEGVQAADGSLTVYAMMPQIAWSGKSVTATLKDTDYVEYSGTFTPKSDQAANKKLKYSVTIMDPDSHPDDEIMTFEDSNVKAICVSQWDTNGDDELSFGEARAVTELPYDVFSENTSIVSFNEFKYFTGLTTTGYHRYTDEGDYEYDGAFSYCTNLKSITLPSSLTSIGIAAFRGCSSLEEMVIPESVKSIGGVAFLGAENLSVYMESATPPTLTRPSSYWSYGSEPFTFGYTYSSSVKIKAIYVPSEAAVSTYKAATWWSSYSNIIQFGLRPTIPVPGMVDLGLPSGLKWATFNLGASSPEELGGYYQWAGLADVTDTSINLDYDNCPYHQQGVNGYSGWTKYSSLSNPSYWSGTGDPDNKMILDPEDDIAHVMLGGKWRMPTDVEFDELINNCTAVFTTINGVYGIRFMRNNNSIFLPAAGLRGGTSLSQTSSHGIYWSSSIYSEEWVAMGHCFDFGNNNGNLVKLMSSRARYSGLSVRPVSE